MPPILERRVLSVNTAVATHVTIDGHRILTGIGGFK